MNGYADSILATIAKLQPGGVLITCLTLLYIALGIDRNVNTNTLSVALIQRDVSALTLRLNAESSANVSMELNQAQVESVHTRIGELRDRVEKLEDK